jgi:hypothetical protein
MTVIGSMLFCIDPIDQSMNDTCVNLIGGHMMNWSSKLILFSLLIFTALTCNLYAELILYYKFDDDPSSVIAVNSAPSTEGNFRGIITTLPPDYTVKTAVFTGSGGGWDGVGGALNTEVEVYPDWYQGIVRVQDPNAALATVDNQVSVAWWQRGSDLLPRSSSSCILGSVNAFAEWILWIENPNVLYGNQFVWQAGVYPDLTSALIELDPNNPSVPGDGQENWYKNKWSHWVCTKNADTGSMKVYRNGVLWYDFPDNFLPIRGDEAFHLTIGAHPYDQNPFIGLLDDVRIYDHELTLAEVRELVCVTQYMADLNSDCVVDIFDLNIMAGEWLSPDTGPFVSDVTGDDKVNLEDFSILADDWGKSGLYE